MCVLRILFFFSIGFSSTKNSTEAFRNLRSEVGELAVIIIFFPELENPALESREQPSERQGGRKTFKHAENRGSDFPQGKEAIGQLGDLGYFPTGLGIRAPGVITHALGYCSKQVESV